MCLYFFPQIFVFSLFVWPGLFQFAISPLGLREWFEKEKNVTGLDQAERARAIFLASLADQPGRFPSRQVATCLPAGRGRQVTETERKRERDTHGRMPRPEIGGIKRQTGGWRSRREGDKMAKRERDSVAGDKSSRRRRRRWDPIRLSWYLLFFLSLRHRSVIELVTRHAADNPVPGLGLGLGAGPPESGLRTCRPSALPHRIGSDRIQDFNLELDLDLDPS